MQRIGDPFGYIRIGGKDTLALAPTRPRRIRMDVNALAESRLYLLDEHGEATFLCRVNGRDVVEFNIDRPVQVMADADDLYVRTADGETVHHVIEDAESFTKIMERRPRNHDLEVIQRTMMQNMQRISNAQQAEFAAIMERREADFAARLAAEAARHAAGAEPVSGADDSADTSAAGSATPRRSTRAASAADAA